MSGSKFSSVLPGGSRTSANLVQRQTSANVPQQIYAPQQVHLDKKDQPILSPRKSTGNNNASARYLPLFNAFWLLVLSLAAVVYVFTGAADDKTNAGVQNVLFTDASKSTQKTMDLPNETKLFPLGQNKDFQVMFNYVPQDGLLSMEVKLDASVKLEQILFYHVCCKQRGDLVCRLGSTRNMGIEGIVREKRKHEIGSSVQHHKREQLVVKVVADHPSMVGSSCWIYYRLK